MIVSLLGTASKLMSEQSDVNQLVFCYRVAGQQETNQMSAANLGIVFGPTLLRPRYRFDSFYLIHCKLCETGGLYLRTFMPCRKIPLLYLTNPGLIVCREGASSLNYLIETPFQTRIVELLINNVEVSQSTSVFAVILGRHIITHETLSLSVLSVHSWNGCMSSFNHLIASSF